MSDSDFTPEADSFSYDLSMDEAARANEAKMIDTLQQQGVFIDMTGCFNLEDKQQQLFADRRQTEASIENLAAEPLLLDSQEMQKLRAERSMLDRKIEIVTLAAGVAIAICEDGDEDSDQAIGGSYPYPISSGAYEAFRVIYQAEHAPVVGQDEETDEFYLHKRVLEIVTSPYITLDDRRALLAATQSLIGAEEYQKVLHDIFRTDRDVTPHTVHI